MWFKNGYVDKWGWNLKTFKLNAWNEGTQIHSKKNELESQVAQEISPWKDEVKGWNETIISNGNGLWELNFKEKLLKVQLGETRVIIHAN
jgi:hypothetical protein